MASVAAAPPASTRTSTRGRPAPRRWPARADLPGGSVTAGNSSGVNDGAAALLVVSEAVVGELGLTPLARVVGAASAGVEPRVMGVGPVPAVQRLLGGAVSP